MVEGQSGEVETETWEMEYVGLEKGGESTKTKCV